MLINALCEYYDVLDKNNKVIPRGYSKIDIDYLISLTDEGKIDGISDFNKSVYIMKRSEKTSICGNIIEHRPLYIFGPNWATKDYDKAVKSHKDFAKKNLEFIDGINSPVVNAYRKFIENWKPEAELENKILIGVGKKFLTAKYAFCLSGRPDILLHEDDKIRAKWEELISSIKPSDDACKAQCCITGKYEEIARVHNKIKGFNAMGSALVNFNNPSDSSYGKSQSINSNISETAMEKYTEAINYLMANKEHKSYLGDITVIHWAATGEEECDDFMSAFVFDDSDKLSEDEANKALDSIAKKLKSGYVGQSAADEAEKYLNVSADYYMVGLKPNSSRLAVKFIYRRKFGEIVKNVVDYQNDMKINGNTKLVSLGRISRELVPPNTSTPDYDAALAARLMDSVVNGHMFPVSLLERVIGRIKLDSDAEKKLNNVRAGIIKAYLNRKSRLNNEKEEITMYLDKTNTNQAYLCGRLFAVLERIQQAAAEAELNRTIRDTYFSTAAAHPAMVFPKVMKLSQYHLSKLNEGKFKYFSKEIGDITDMLNGEFPNVLNLTEQGKFIIGYYQQRNSYYNTKKESE